MYSLRVVDMVVVVVESKRGSVGLVAGARATNLEFVSEPESQSYLHGYVRVRDSFVWVCRQT